MSVNNSSASARACASAVVRPTDTGTSARTARPAATAAAALTSAARSRPAEHGTNSAVPGAAAGAGSASSVLAVQPDPCQCAPCQRAIAAGVPDKAMLMPGTATWLSHPASAWPASTTSPARTGALAASQFSRIALSAALRTGPVVGHHGWRNQAPAKPSRPTRVATCRARVRSSRPSITTLNVTARAGSDSLTLSSMASHANGAAGVASGSAHSLAAAVPDAIAEFARKLRWLGVEVSISEVADALGAIREADLLDRDQLRRRLQVTLVKRAADIPTFAAAFDLLFPALGAPADGGGARARAQDGQHASPDGQPASPDLLARLVALLRGDPGAGVSELAAEVISAYAGLQEGQVTGSQRYYEYRVMRQLDLSALLHRAMQLDDDAARPRLSKQLARMEQQERLAELRAEIAAQLRARLAELRGRQASLGLLRDSVLDTEFLRAGPAELAAMRAIVRPLARRLAATARRRRRANRTGKLDVRRTLRRAISAGGVPLDPAWRLRRRSRPRLLVLCDVSGSVAEFAKFTLSLLHALHAELPRLRSFVFADGVAEVTDLLRSSPGVIDSRMLLSRPGVVRGDGHSDYGAVLHRFLDEQARELSRDCVLIICGDARTNYRPERADLLRTLRGRVRAIHWLNPEPAAGWNSTDSRIGRYEPYCDSVTEVRTLRQLSEWAGKLL